MLAVQSLPEVQSVSFQFTPFAAPQSEGSDLFREAADLALQVTRERELPIRYRTFKHADFQKNPEQMCTLIQASRGKLTDIPKSLHQKLTEAGKYLETLTLTNIAFSEGQLKSLSVILPNVKTVRLQKVTFSSSINELGCFEKMTRLSLAQSSPVTELNSDALKNVEAFDLSETPVDDALLKKLNSSKKLNHLFLAYCRKFTEAGFKEALKIPGLKTLNIFDCWQISTRAITNADRTHKHITVNLVSYSQDAFLTPPRSSAASPLNPLSSLAPPRPKVNFPAFVPRS